MSNLINNILNKNRKINFNFSKSLNENIYQVQDKNPDSDLPISPEETSWASLNENNIHFMFKLYIFDHAKHLEYFVSQILKKSNEIDHHPILLIDKNTVDIKLYTRDINDITELDTEYAKYIDEIYEEIDYILEL